MKRLLTFSLLLWATVASAQFGNPIYNDWDQGYAVGVHGRYQASSNALTTNLLWKAYQGKFLERKLREKVSELHGNSNRIGVDLDYGIFAKHLPDSAKGLGWFINVANRTHINVKYPKDLFDLAMFGNAQYAGQTVSLSPIEVNYMTYTQYEIGLLKQLVRPKAQWNFGLGLSLLSGKRNLNLSISQADLFTHEDGEYLDGEVHGSIRSSSLSSGQYFDANGIGFSASMYLGYSSAKFGIALSGDDLGIINWSKHLKHTDLDSVFQFEGVDVNLFSDGNPVIAINLDSVVDGFASKRVAESYISTVAGRIRLQAHYMLNDKQWKLYFGVQYRIAPSYVPYVFVGTNSPLGKGFAIDGRLAYGGFGSWHIGLEFQKRFSDFLLIRLGTNNLEGYVLPMVGTSQSAFVGITGMF